MTGLDHDRDGQKMHKIDQFHQRESKEVTHKYISSRFLRRV